jgi:hypothetical protein
VDGPDSLRFVASLSADQPLASLHSARPAPFKAAGAPNAASFLKRLGILTSFLSHVKPINGLVKKKRCN